MANEEDDDMTIVQLLPGAGWRAIHSVDGDLERRPLVGWALLEDGDVVPLETDPGALTSESSELPSFVAVEHETAPIPEAELQRLQATRRR